MSSADAPVWTPSPERVRQANLTAFLAFLRTKDIAPCADYGALYRWSVESPEEFWAALWDFCGVVASRRWNRVAVDLDRMPGARWFEGAHLNFAENLLRFRDDQPAIIFWNESGQRRRLSFAGLFTEVSRLAAALRDAGVVRGDRVAAWMPNMPEALIAMLAATSLGAVWSSCSPDFGAKGVLDRFGQIQPKVLFTVDGYCYGGKRIELTERVREVVKQLPATEKIVVVGYLEAEPALPTANAVRYAEFTAAQAPPPMRFEQLPFDHPLYILYSSGTTGLPKCMIHGAGGTLLQHLKELVLHADLKRGNRIFYYTTCGWMMWNWLVSGLATGATVVLYDGSPIHPKRDILFDLAEQEGVTVFGTSAKYLAMIEKEGLAPRESHDLSALRTILSTGSPLAPQSFDYVYEKVKADVCLSSISGGTDIVSCFALGNPIGPVYRGEIQTPGLGMKVEIFNDAGKPVRGEKGELVCTKPFPSMPVGFWNDPDGAKYRAAYFEDYPGVWRHGDWAELTAHGGLVIHGRSDATLNPGGIRIGTAEIYRQVEQFEEVAESLVIGQEWRGDLRIVLFVRMRDGLSLGDELQQRIRKRIRESASPHHVPRIIIQVADIPRTISGKITELAVREVIHNRPVKNRDALANPEALELFRDLPELRDE
jgi:acetoacetyl-CoA synthetase